MKACRVRRGNESVGYVVEAFRTVKCPLCADAQLF
jgi:hypothetical protein